MIDREPSIIEPIIQKDIGDCAVAALAMVLQLPYVLVSQAAIALSSNVHHKGLHTTELICLSKQLGRPLKKIKSKRIGSHPTGLLLVTRTRKSNHAVAVLDGVIINPSDGLLYRYDVYVDGKKTKALHLLVRSS